VRLLGRGRAMEMLLSADDHDADLAERYGWLNRSLEPDVPIHVVLGGDSERPVLAKRCHSNQLKMSDKFRGTLLEMACLGLQRRPTGMDAIRSIVLKNLDSDFTRNN